jgi:solute carrier family 8 (sodium/calcium exchanger)
LGPSTIVGSAAFNLLVISAVSIYAVGDEPKKIDDLGVFAITTISSFFAYIWLFLCLSVFEPDYIDLSEASLTLAYFLILIILAYIADKINEKKLKAKENEDEKKDRHIKER